MGDRSRSARSGHARAGVLLAGLLAGPGACKGGGAGGSGQFLWLDHAQAGSAMVQAATGGSVITRRGDLLVIPPGALDQDTMITLTPVRLPADPTLDFLGAVATEPHGLQFRQPAVLSVQLSVPMRGRGEVMLAESVEPGQPRRFAGSGTLFTVDESGSTAAGPIHGFSSKGVMVNCHSGTRNTLIGAWGSTPGRDPASLSSQSGVPLQALSTCDATQQQLGADSLQRLLRPYFAQCGEFTPGQPFDQAARDLVSRTVASGRQVVFLFGSSMMRNPATGEWGSVSHSGIAAVRNGRMTIRNQINIAAEENMRSLEDGAPVEYSPLDQIDLVGQGVRGMRSGEMASIVRGQTYLPPSDRAAMGRPWGHVVLLCETAGPQDGGVVEAARPEVGGDARVPDLAPPMPDARVPDLAPDRTPDVMACPMYTSTIGFCAGEGGCAPGGAACAGTSCIPGFCFTRSIIGCTQEKCPPFAYRSYTNYCLCPMDKKAIYDPCRAGFVVSCDPL